MNRSIASVSVLGAIVACSSEVLAQADDWPAVFDPFQVLTLNLDVDAEDWQIIQQDETFDIEVPAMFWADGEDPILVSVRRKSATALTAAPEFDKVSLKIDINEYVDQVWHGLKKLSLENGDDQDVVSEGLAWHLHRLASGPEGYGYPSAYAAWIRLNINGVDTGVYASVEQRDKQFLKNRDMYVSDETWLYKVGDINGLELKVGEPDSPAVEVLCYPPFNSGPPACETPDDATLTAELPLHIDMQGMLTLGAVNAFAANPDAMLSHGKNFFFADFLQGSTRLYFPWDLDAALSGSPSANDIYEHNSIYADVLLNVQAFRDQYTGILNDLLGGPLAEAELVAFLDAVEPLLAAALDADPNSQLGGSASDHFDGLRAWVASRRADVIAQLEFIQVTCPADLDDSGDVGFSDLLAILGAWGNAGSPEDLDQSGTVDFGDLLIVLGSWGPCA